jgi:kynurenine formamidase
MKLQTLVVGYSFALALFLFAQHRPGEGPQAGGFRTVVDLTRSLDLAQPSARVAGVATDAGRLAAPAGHSGARPRPAASETRSGTRIVAPAVVASGLWNVDQIPAERLVAPLVVLDVTAAKRGQSGHQVSVEDIARWERENGEIPLNSVVMARTGWNSTGQNRAEFSPDAALFLVEGRKVLGLGSDASSPAGGDTGAEHYSLSHSVYQLEGVANLDRVPEQGAVVVVAPTKIERTSSAPVRIMALVR